MTAEEDADSLRDLLPHLERHRLYHIASTTNSKRVLDCVLRELEDRDALCGVSLHSTRADHLNRKTQEKTR